MFWILKWHDITKHDFIMMLHYVVIGRNALVGSDASFAPNQFESALRVATIPPHSFEDAACYACTTHICLSCAKHLDRNILMAETNARKHEARFLVPTILF